MAVAFKVSCCVYWFTGIFCMTYLMGTSLYTDRFVYSNLDSARNVQAYILHLSIFNMCYSFIGCVFVKCNITHIIYAVLFVFPMLGVNFSLSILGLIETRTTTSQFPSPAEMIENAVEFFKGHNNQYPIWMHHIQEISNCCGIVSFLDFPAFLYTSETRLQDSLPPNCCYDLKANKNKDCVKSFNLTGNSKASAVNISSVYAAQVKQCKIANPAYVNKNIVPMIRNLHEFYLLSDMKPILPPCGCYQHMKDAFEMMFNTSHFIFFITILGMTIVMLFVYIKNWCHSRGLTSSSSDHSLVDTDNWSPNIPQQNPDAYEGDVTDSAVAMPEKSMALTKVNIGDTSTEPAVIKENAP